MRTIRILASTAALLAVAALPAAAATRHKSSFDVKFGGLTVGQATFNIEYDETGYKVDARGKTAGIVDLFAPGKGVARSDGAIETASVVARKHFVEYEQPEKTDALEIDFANGAVEKVNIISGKPRKKKGKRWVPVEPEQLKSVIDPASSLVIPVAAASSGNGAAVCNRTFNLYDGDARYDVALKYKSTRQIETEGYKGTAYVCQLRYIPVSGHRRNEKNVDYMAGNKDMEVWLAPISGTELFTPIRFDVPTWVGTVIAYPTYFGAADK
ncbi:MAG: DUF3108 domain-containing protein [Nitratireductor sp.]|nr:DUF3108 domain-containing protein [Nitratireductor sp.]